MRNKKAISVFLAILLCLTATIIVVTANTKTVSVEILTDKSELSTGETATASVRVTTNFPVATMSIPIFYDKTLVSVSDATATLNDYAVKNATIDSQSVDSYKVYADTDISEDDYGFVLVNYIGSAGEEAPETIDEVVLTFTITANSGVEGDALINCVSESAKTDNNVTGMLYFGSTTNGTVIDSIPENVENIDVTDANETIAITKVAEPNTLVIKDDAPYRPVIDTVNKGEFTGTIYGIDTLGWDDTLEADGTLADFLTTAYGDEYLEIVVGYSGVETTGTVINVLDENDNTIETYVFVYFGDVDNDGMISANDALVTEYYEATYEGIETYGQYIATDLDGDGMASAKDALIAEYYEATYEGVDHQYNIGQLASNNIYEWVY